MIAIFHFERSQKSSIPILEQLPPFSLKDSTYSDTSNSKPWQYHSELMPHSQSQRDYAGTEGVSEAIN